MHSKYHLAQGNFSYISGDSMEDPVMKEFVDNLEKINNLADNSPGFVWRLQDESGIGATNIQIFEDPKFIINMSVWEDQESLYKYVYKSEHVDFLARRSKWFEPLSKHSDLPGLVLWWIPEGHLPTPEELKSKLEYLRDNGPSSEAFSFANSFPAPNDLIVE